MVERIPGFVYGILVTSMAYDTTALPDALSMM